MAAIKPISLGMIGKRAVQIRKQVAQATVGQTDWVMVPEWAKYARVTVNVTATAGTTPICLLALLTVDPVTLDDGVTGFVGGATTTTGITSTGEMVVSIGPGVTGIANDVVLAVSGVSNAFINDVLPQVLGIQCLNDRTTGDETYTYTVTVEFRQ